MTNADIAEFFTMLSRLMDLHGEDAFKAKSYSIAAYHIEQLERDLSAMTDSDIRDSKGIGASTAAKIREILDTGALTQLTESINRTPTGVLDIMQIKGLGPKKVRTIWKEMGIESVGELEYACNENRLAAFKGFGQKTQEAVLQNISFLRANQGFQLWASVEKTAEAWVQKLRVSFPRSRFELCGAIPRQLEVVSQIEILTDLPEHTLPQIWAKAPGISMVPDAEYHTLLVSFGDGINVLFRFVTPEKLYHELFRYNAEPSFLHAFEERFPIPEQLAAEADIFSAHQLQFIPVPMRESASVLDLAVQHALPECVTEKDIRGLIHCHSRWSDGQETIETMAQHAIGKGWEYMVITDHSQSAYYAGGLKPADVAAQHQEVDALNAGLDGRFRIYKSIESDILNDGSLDYEPAVLQTFDLVIASIHSNLKMSPEKAMQRLLTAIQNPYTNIMGHLTGRLLLSREGYPVDHKMIIDACADYDVAIEINAHPRRLDLDWRWVGYALERGVLLSINPDAHALAGFDDVYYGCKVAQKAGLTKEHNLSSFGRDRLEKFIESQHRKRNLQAL
ncbi:MAG: helix-hairpin-helix domain-containing protein [Chitinophagaceae bacterium]